MRALGVVDVEPGIEGSLEFREFPASVPGSARGLLVAS